MKDLLTIACDGGCRGNGKANSLGGWGVVLVYGSREKELCGAERSVTSQQMELTALLKGLQAVKDKTVPTEVKSDSAYLINCFQQFWYRTWRLNGWKTSTGGPVKNVELWKEILSEVEKFDSIKFIKVKGHSGNVLNERADRLATLAMDRL